MKLEIHTEPQRPEIFSGYEIDCELLAGLREITLGRFAAEQGGEDFTVLIDQNSRLEVPAPSGIMVEPMIRVSEDASNALIEIRPVQYIELGTREPRLNSAQIKARSRVGILSGKGGDFGENSGELSGKNLLERRRAEATMAVVSGLYRHQKFTSDNSGLSGTARRAGRTMIPSFFGFAPTLLMTSQIINDSLPAVITAIGGSYATGRAMAARREHSYPERQSNKLIRQKTDGSARQHLALFARRGITPIFSEESGYRN